MVVSDKEKREERREERRGEERDKEIGREGRRVQAGNNRPTWLLQDLLLLFISSHRHAGREAYDSRGLWTRRSSLVFHWS